MATHKEIVIGRPKKAGSGEVWNQGRNSPPDDGSVAMKGVVIQTFRETFQKYIEIGTLKALSAKSRLR
jgi:hypothetical protein